MIGVRPRVNNRPILSRRGRARIAFRLEFFRLSLKKSAIGKIAVHLCSLLDYGSEVFSFPGSYEIFRKMQIMSLLLFKELNIIVK